jgi:glutathione S-transferase
MTAVNGGTLAHCPAGDQFTEEFKKINPNSKIPALVDPDGPGGFCTAY